VILGIDEAGRGPVIGPLVLCGVWVKKRSERRLLELGVRDSKAFGSTATAREQRHQIARQIREVVHSVTLLTADAGEVDRHVVRGELNRMERELARAIIDSGPPARGIVADGARLFGPLQRDFPTLEAVDRADQHSPAVAAASILAKVERDRRFEEIVAPFQDELGPIRGGGYVNKGTEAFLRGHVARYGGLPGETRRSWSWAVLEELVGPGALLRRQLELGGR
jgi:ribonuclease HII